MHYIYSITNTVTGDVYVGQAIWLKKRFSTHRCSLRRGKHHNRFLQRSYDKYGEAAFDYKALEECVNLEVANQREAVIIESLKIQGCRVFNIRAGGKNDRMTEEHKRRIGDALRGKSKSLEHRAKISEVQRGRKQTPELVAKRMAARAWYVPTEEHRRRLSEASKGKPKTEAHKQSIREAKKRGSS